MRDEEWSRHAPIYISCAILTTIVAAAVGNYWPLAFGIFALFRRTRQAWAVLGTLALPLAAFVLIP